MIDGYVRSGFPQDAFELLRRMQLENVRPNEFSLISLLCAATVLESIKLGSWILDFALKNGFEIGDCSRKEGMERKDVMTKNVSIYKSRASFLDVILTEVDLPLEEAVINPENHNSPLAQSKDNSSTFGLDVSPCWADSPILQLNIDVPSKAIGIDMNHVHTVQALVVVQTATKTSEALTDARTTTTKPMGADDPFWNHAVPNCKVLVVVSSTNTIALILVEYAPSIHAGNITGLTRLDHKMALGQISELMQDDHWLMLEFITTVQQQGAAIIKARKFASALSAASYVCDQIGDRVLGPSEGTWVSMRVYSDGSYNVPPCGPKSLLLYESSQESQPKKKRQQERQNNNASNNSFDPKSYDSTNTFSAFNCLIFEA